MKTIFVLLFFYSLVGYNSIYASVRFVENNDNKKSNTNLTGIPFNNEKIDLAGSSFSLLPDNNK